MNTVYNGLNIPVDMDSACHTSVAAVHKHTPPCIWQNTITLYNFVISW